MQEEIEDILSAVKDLASRYKKLTGKPLGVTGEVAEYNAAKLLDLKLAVARTAGYDAIGSGNRKIQIKGRCLCEKPKPGQRLGSIRLDHEWDSVLLVLMNELYEVVEIWEALRPEVEAALLHPGSKARNERGAFSIVNSNKSAKSCGLNRWLNNASQGDCFSVAASASTTNPPSLAALHVLRRIRVFRT